MLKKIMSAVLAAACVMSAGAFVSFANENDLPILPGGEIKQGDVNLDSKVNIKDATAIQKHIAGMETGFAIGQPV